jgi:PAS domain S-box-containing protein
MSLDPPGTSVAVCNQTDEQTWIPFLLELTERLTVDNLQDVGRFALQYLVQATGADFGDIKLIQETEANPAAVPILHEVSARFIATWGEPLIAELQTVVEQPVPFGQGVLWQVVETGEPVFVEDYASHPNAIDQFRPLNLGHLGIFPIRNLDRKVIGVLTLECRSIESASRFPSYDMVMAACRVMGTVVDRKQRETEHQKTQEALRQRELCFRRMAEANILGILVSEKNGRVLDANDAFLKMLGYTREDLQRGRLHLDRMTPPDQLPLDELATQQLQATGVISPREKQFICQDGSRVSVLMGCALLEEGGEKTVAFVLDLTSQKQLEAILQETNEKLSILVEQRTDELRAAIAQLHQEALSRRQTLAALQETEMRYQSVVLALQEGVVLQDADGIIQACNPSAERILGRPGVEILGTRSLAPEGSTIREDGSPFQQEMHPATISLHTGLPCSGVAMGIYQPQGTLVWVRMNSQPLLREGESKPYAVVTSFSDITERKQTQRQLQDTLQQLNFHVENSPLGVIEWDADIRIIRWSKEAENIFGWTAEEVLGKRINQEFPFVHVEDQAIVSQVVEELFNTSIQRRVSFNRNYRKDGSIVYCEWYNSVLQDESGKVVSILTLVLDVTERTLAEEELRRQGLRSRLFADITLKIRHSFDIEQILQTTVTEVRQLLMVDRVLIYHLLPDGTGIVMNESTTPDTASLVGAAFLPETFPHEYRAMFLEGRIRRIDDIEMSDLTPCHTQLLRELNVKAKLVVPLVQGNKLWGLIIAHQCHQTRHWTEFEVDLLQQLAHQVSIALSQSYLWQALRDSEERFRQLTENIKQVFWMWNPQENRVVYVSPAYEQIWGCTCDSLYQDGHSWMTVIHPDDRERVVAAFATSLEPSDQEYRIVRADGEIRWIRDRAFPIKNDLGEIHLIAGIAEDITRRKQQQERLRLLESVVVNANDAVLITEAEPINLPGPRIVYVNEAFSRLTGYTAEEVVGKTPRILQGAKTNRDTLNKIRDALEHWQPIVVELINYRKNGSEFWVELSITPVADHNGWFTHWVAIQRDISRRKQLEEELLKTLEQEKELSELKSRFVAMTSHEFRTPLSTILSSAELLEHYGHQWTEAERLDQLHLIQNTVQHMTQLLEDVLLIGKAESDRLEFNPGPLDLTRFCHDLALQIQVSVGKRHRIDFLSRCPEAIVRADEKLLRQILTNLLSNAVKYSPAGSTVQFELACDSETVRFQIKDQGIGIPPEEGHRLFEAFHRAKNVGTIPGTGLGLTIVKHCLDAHNGSIHFTSEVNAGTTFVVTVPLKEG